METRELLIEERIDASPVAMKIRPLLIAVLLAGLAAPSWSAPIQIAITLKLAPGQDPNADAAAKAAQLQIGELLAEPSFREVLPGPSVRISASGWSAAEGEKRERALAALKAAWGDKLTIDESSAGDAGGAARRASKSRVEGEKVAGTISGAVPACLVSGDQSAVYDGKKDFGAAGAEIPATSGGLVRPAAVSRLGAVSKAPSSSGIDLAAIDRAVSPCADFYQYSCGSWLKSNPIPADQTTWGRFSEIDERNQKTLQDILEKSAAAVKAKGAEEKKLADLYAACMDAKAIEKQGAAPLKPDLAAVDKLSSLKDLAGQIARLQKKGMGGLFGFGSEQDFEDAGRMIAAIDQGGITLPDRDYYLEERNAQTLKDYAVHAENMFKLAGDSPARAKAEAGRLISVETALARIAVDNVSRRDPARIHKKVPLAVFRKLTPSFDWPAYFAALGAPKLASIDVNSIEFFSQLDGVLKSQSLAAWKSYLRWQVIHSRASMLSSAFDKENFNFFGRKLAGQKEQRPRWKRCVGVADGVMGEALGKEFVARSFPGGAKTETLRMVGEIEAAMKENITGSAWMTPQTRQKALAKLVEVTNKIGYPDKWRDYSKLKISRTAALGNMQRSAELETARDIAKIGKPADRTEWGMTPPTVNAYYDPSNNNINFPAGILQPPFYDPKSDAAVNFGAIGAIEGHELTHGFDDEGRQYDGKGNLNAWWTAQDQQAFESRAKGLVAQYSKFLAVKDPGGDPKKDVYVNGELTLGENIADNGGLRLAYSAFLKDQAGRPQQVVDGYTPAQRFFLGFGQSWCSNQTPESAKLQAQTDPHSPDKARVLGTLANMGEFAQAFSCKPGDAMVNPSPARVW